jgi:alpha-D-ribose 1-methylphosphonate 5-triphosphate synthase subunit PhnG
VTFDRDRRCELLAVADPAALKQLAERCLDQGPPVTVLSGPEIGAVALQVREPVAHERFYLGEALVTRVEVDADGSRGWAMRMGTDRLATLAAAILDATAASEGASRSLAAEIDELCRATEDELAAADSEEWAELALTEVQFEELD